MDKNNKPGHVVILTDSLSSIQSIDSGKSRTQPDLLDKILIAISDIIRLGIIIHIDWCPSHFDIAINYVYPGVIKSTKALLEHKYAFKISRWCNLKHYSVSLSLHSLAFHDSYTNKIVGDIFLGRNKVL